MTRLTRYFLTALLILLITAALSGCANDDNSANLQTELSRLQAELTALRVEHNDLQTTFAAFQDEVSDIIFAADEAEPAKFAITLRCPYQDIILDGGFYHVSGEPLLVSVPVPTREGYVFGGFIDHIGQEVFRSDGEPAFTGTWTMVSDHTLRAIWHYAE